MFFPMIPVIPPNTLRMSAMQALAKPHRPLYRKVMWTEHEDSLLLEAIEKFGKNWAMVATNVPGRNGKQCRERWSGMLNPELARDAWSPEEDRLLIKLHDEYGNKWAMISTFLPGRSRISLRNRWGWHVRHSFKRTRANVVIPAPEPVGNMGKIEDVKGETEVAEFDPWTDDFSNALWTDTAEPECAY